MHMQQYQRTIFLLAASWWVGCADSDKQPDISPPQPLTVEFQHSPIIESANARTVVVVDFIVRRSDRTPLEPQEVDVNLFVNDKPIDTESNLDRSDSRLKVDLNLYLVLDASFSMLSQPIDSVATGATNAFELMLRTATQTRSVVRDIWKSKSQDAFTNVEMVFFDKWIYHAEGDWSDAQINEFPEPSPGAETKLLGAAHFAASRMKGQHDGGLAAAERDKHVMILFTDGQDNVSTLDNTVGFQPPCTGFCSAPTIPICQDGSLMPNCPNESTGFCFTPNEKGAYTSQGYPCVDRRAIEDTFLGHPNLEVHVLGLGNQVNEDELDYLAKYGHGSLLRGGTADDIPKLFENVLKEFATVNSQGADIPQPAGTYTFAIEVKEKANPTSGAMCSFQYRNNPDSADPPVTDSGNCVAWPAD